MKMDKLMLLIIALVAILKNVYSHNMMKIPQTMNNGMTVKEYIEKEIESYGRNIIYFVNDNNESVKTELNLPDNALLESSEDMDNVTFRLYTPEVTGNYEILKINDSETLAKSHFDIKRPTRFVTHGYLASANGSSCTLIRDAYLNNSNCNVIVIDWSQISIGPYVRARLYLEPIGKYISSMINFLAKNGMNENTTTLVGHSLGAHLMGYAGNNVIQKVNYTIGLDPAMPLFILVGPNERISPDDAKFVEIIHTNGGLLGDPKRLGDFDFYPNGGSIQPGCPDTLELATCSHSRSYQYFAESLKNSSTPFVSVKCDSIDDYNSHNCENIYTIMGGIDYVPQYNGSYYLTTSSSPPFSSRTYSRRIDCQGGLIGFIEKLINFFIGNGYTCDL